MCSIEKKALFYMGRQGVFPSALPICVSCVCVHWKCVSGERDAVRDVPRYPPGRGSSWAKEPIVYPGRVT